MTGTVKTGVEPSMCFICIEQASMCFICIEQESAKTEQRPTVDLTLNSLSSTLIA